MGQDGLGASLLVFIELVDLKGCLWILFPQTSILSGHFLSDVQPAPAYVPPVAELTASPLRVPVVGHLRLWER